MKLNRIYNEDCRETLFRMPGDFVDLVLTSPPYDDLRTYHGYAFDFKTISQELYRVIKPGGVLVWVADDSTKDFGESLTVFRQAIDFQELGFRVSPMIYSKLPRGINGNSQLYWSAFEYMIVCFKGKPKTINLIKDRPNVRQGTIYKPGNRRKDGTRKPGRTVTFEPFGRRTNVWHYNQTDLGDKIAKRHPAVFPELLARDHILSWSNEGDLVYDPFMGSGTTAKVALVNNRNYIGSEISEEYVKLAEERLAPYRNRLL